MKPIVKEIFLVLVLSALSQPLWAEDVKAEAAPPVAAPATVVEEQQSPQKAKNFTGSVVQLEQKETYFQVTLPENPTTGFRCYLSDYDHAFLEPISSSYTPPDKKDAAAAGEKPSKNLVGAAGTRTFVFQVKPIFKNAPHKTKLEFQYHRPWSADDKGKKKTITVYSS